MCVSVDVMWKEWVSEWLGVQKYKHVINNSHWEGVLYIVTGRLSISKPSNSNNAHYWFFFFLFFCSFCFFFLDSHSLNVCANDNDNFLSLISIAAAAVAASTATAAVDAVVTITIRDNHCCPCCFRVYTFGQHQIFAPTIMMCLSVVFEWIIYIYIYTVRIREPRAWTTRAKAFRKRCMGANQVSIWRIEDCIKIVSLFSILGITYNIYEYDRCAAAATTSTSIQYSLLSLPVVVKLLLAHCFYFYSLSDLGKP